MEIKSGLNPHRSRSVYKKFKTEILFMKFDQFSVKSWELLLLKVPMKLLCVFFMLALSIPFSYSCEMVSSQFEEGASVTKYAPRPGKGPTTSEQVLILPPTGGENMTDRGLARSLCRRGHLVIIFNYLQLPEVSIDLSIHDQTNRKLLDLIDRYLTLEARQTTIIGSSLGGIYASMIFSAAQNKNPQWPGFRFIKNLVTIAAGGSLADVLGYSTQEAVIVQRARRFKEYNFKTVKEYTTALNQAIELDPIRNAKPSKNVLVYASTNDPVVPSFTQVNLAKAYGQRPRMIKGLGHAGTIAYVLFAKAQEISSFIRK